MGSDLVIDMSLSTSALHKQLNTTTDAISMHARGTKIDCEIVTSFPELEALEADWNRLRDQTIRGDVFSSIPWARATWRAFGHNRTICTPVLRVGGNVVGIFPLAIERGVLRFLASPHADVNEALIDERLPPHSFAKALDALKRVDLPWRHCLLERVPEGSPTHRLLSGMVGHWAKWTHVSGEGVCPAFRLVMSSADRTGIFQEKSHLRQLSNRLSRAGTVVYRPIQDREQILEHLPAFFDQHVCRWALAGIRSPYLFTEPRAFIQALVEELDPRVSLHFSALELNGHPIAFHLGFTTPQRFLYYKPTFDVDHWELSAGQVLMGHLIDDAAHQGFPRFDLGLGDEPYKRRFATEETRVLDFQIERCAFGAWQATTVAQAKPLLRRSPGLEKLTQTLAQGRARLRTLRLAHFRPSAVMNTFRRVVNRYVFDRYRLVVYAHVKKSEGREPAPPELSDLEIREARVSDLARLSLGERPDSLGSGQIARLRDRLRDGDTCWIAAREGRIVGICWSRVVQRISLCGSVEPTTFSCPVRELHDAWILPTERNRRVFSRLLLQLSSIDSSDSHPVIIAADIYNRASRREIERIGFRPFLIVGRVRVLGRFSRGFREVLDPPLAKKLIRGN